MQIALHLTTYQTGMQKDGITQILQPVVRVEGPTVRQTLLWLALHDVNCNIINSLIIIDLEDTMKLVHLCKQSIPMPILQILTQPIGPPKQDFLTRCGAIWEKLRPFQVTAVKFAI